MPEQWKRDEMHGFDLPLALAYGMLKSLEYDYNPAAFSAKTRREMPIRTRAVRDLIGYIEEERERKYGGRSQWWAEHNMGEPPAEAKGALGDG